MTTDITDITDATLVREELAEQAPQFRMRGIPCSLIEHFWPFAEPYVKRALDHGSGEFLPADLKRLCQERLTQLWLVSENERVVGAVITEIVVYPRRKHLLIHALAGSKFPEWVQLADTILAAYAQEFECNAVSAVVRRGFVSVLNNYGYKQKHSVVVKEL